MSKRNICFAVAALLATIMAVLIVIFAISSSYDNKEKTPKESDDINAPTKDDAVRYVFDRDLRGVWIASVYNIDYPSSSGLDAERLKAEIDDIISTSASAGINAVFFQVRPSSDALYSSDIFPVSAYLTGVQGKELPFGFDPLAYLVEKAHAENISVHAWVNPVRVTTGSSKYPQTDFSKLAESNPARQNPDLVVIYNDACMYYDIGIPKTRSLIADGVREIAANYDVDGIVFDDYFYPYPSDGAYFDDEATYKMYGESFSDIGEFRRDNVNKLVKLCYDSIKEEREDCLFGISPFGIWSNDDGKNGGSATSGLDAYNTIYCDALAWAEGGYVDYIAPQLYWQFSSKAAPFGELADWWNKKLSEYGVPLCISYAGYKVEDWNDCSEILRQLEYASTLSAYDGGIIYGYSALKKNALGITDAISSVFLDTTSDLQCIDTTSDDLQYVDTMPDVQYGKGS